MRLRKPVETHFATLVESIVHQQLAGRAAAAIHGRLISALDGRVEPEAVLALADEQMRAAGLSANKTASLRDLAAKVLDGTVILEPHRLARVPDDEVVTRLTAVRGIGEWTAQMFLLFQLRRMDVWPTGDLGVRKGYGWPGASRRRRPSSCGFWASPFARTGPSRRGTAGERWRSSPGRPKAP